jgi:hypothetical protein
MERKRGIQIKEGDRINRWTVIKEVESESGSSNFEDKRFLCRCDCGTERVLRYKSLAYKTSKSCGCYMREFNSKNRRKFPQDTVKSRIYTIWNGIKCRCYTKSSMSYKRYGAKGITMCNEWRTDFMIFYKWSIKNGYADNLTIDRIDSNGNYEPSNCRWVDRKTQCNNQRNNHYVIYKGERLTLSQVAEKYNINQHRLACRLLAGWDVNDAIEIPVFKGRKRNNV